MPLSLSRRDALRKLIVGAASASLAPALAKAADPGLAAQPAGQPPAAQPPGACVLTPQAMEGPFYFDPQLVRADITEGRPGAPLDLSLRIVEQGPCTPIANARVDVWHADAGGIYSGYAGQGDDGRASSKSETHLRGTQMTDADGKVTFRSVYPGWYPGRTPHIHVKVFLDTTTVLTGQIYFPDDLSARVYRDRAPYDQRPVADMTNDRDFLFKAGEREGGGIVLATEEKDGGLISAALVIAVDRSGEAAKGQGWRRILRDMIGR
jgi:protocatechuate 3,4-dioxygenase beta subunit